MRRGLLYFILLFAVLFQSCDNGDSKNTYNGEPVLLKFNFIPGTQYQYLLDSKLAVEPEVNGVTMTINQDMKLVASYVVNSTVNNGKQVSITYDRITMKSGNSMLTKEFDSDDTANVDPIFLNVKDMVHKPFNMTIADNGDVIAFEQPLIDDSSSTDPMTDSSIRKMMTQSLNIYPSTAVKPGDTWTKTFTSSIGFINMNLANSYKLVSVNNGMAHIELSSKITPELNSNVQELGMDITGVQTGTLEVEIGTGLITDAKITQQMKGKLNMGGNEVPMNAKAEIHITGTRVK